MSAASRSLISRDQAQPPYFAGIDLGGTNIKIGLLDDLGRTLASQSMATEVRLGPEEGARRMGQGVLDLITQVGLQPADVQRVGLATPGTMDLDTGMLLEPFNLPGWFHFPIRDRVSHYCGLPVTYSNDANAACWGEFWQGAGHHFDSMILLTLGTGVGGGIIVDNMAIVGEHGVGAECGHIIIDCRDDARVCSCGARGHLEAYASATAVVARTLEALDAGRASSINQRRAGGEVVTPLLIAQEAEQGDPFALEIVLETARYLGIGIVTLIHTIDPDGVVLGGGMTFGGDDNPLGKRFLNRIRHEVTRRGLPPATEKLVIDFATLGGDAGYIGAAGLARLDYLKTPHS